MKPLIFLSHAKEDWKSDTASFKLARERIGKLVNEFGGEMFWDEECIQTGTRDWASTITKEIGRSRVFIALISPRYFESENCGKEWALFESRCKREPVQIIAIQWSRSKFPVCMSRWQRLQVAGNDYYEESGYLEVLRRDKCDKSLLLKLKKDIGAALRGTLEPLDLEWADVEPKFGRLCEYIDPTPLYERIGIAGQKGRRLLLDELERFAAKPNRTRTLIIQAGFGAGKTSVMARLAKNNPDFLHVFGDLLPLGKPGIELGVASLTGQLVARWGIAPQGNEKSSVTFFPLLVGEALRRFPHKMMVFVIDALDQLDASFTRHLFGQGLVLPDRVSIIASVRSGGSFEVPKPFRILDLHDSRFVEDNGTREYLQTVAGEDCFQRWLKESGISAEQFKESLLEKSEGNWLYIDQATQEFRRHQSVESLYGLPVGLTQLVADFWLVQSRFRTWSSFKMKVLAAFVALNEPATLDELLTYCGSSTDLSLSNSDLQDWQSMLTCHQGRFSFSHIFFREFFESKHCEDVLGREHLNFIEDVQTLVKELHGRIASWFLVSWGGLSKGLPLLVNSVLSNVGMNHTWYYGLKYVPYHLAKAGRLSDLADLLNIELESSNSCGGGNLWWTIKHSSSAYAEDVRSALEHEESISSATGLFYWLTLATVRALSNTKFEPELLPRLVEEGLWSELRAVSCALAPPNSCNKADCLLALLGANWRFSSSVFGVLRDALEDDSIPEPKKALAIAKIATASDKAKLQEALRIARGLASARMRVKTFCEIASALPESERKDCLIEATLLTTEIDSAISREEAFQHIARLATQDLDDLVELVARTQGEAFDAKLGLIDQTAPMGQAIELERLISSVSEFLQSDPSAWKRTLARVQGLERANSTSARVVTLLTKLYECAPAGEKAMLKSKIWSTLTKIKAPRTKILCAGRIGTLVAELRTQVLQFLLELTHPSEEMQEPPRIRWSWIPKAFSSTFSKPAKNKSKSSEDFPGSGVDTDIDISDALTSMIPYLSDDEVSLGLTVAGRLFEQYPEESWEVMASALVARLASKELHRVLELTETMSREFHKERLVSNISKRYAQLGLFDEALETLERVAHPRLLDETLEWISGEYCNRKKSVPAMELAVRIKEVELRAETMLRVIEKGEATEFFFDEAFEFFKKLPEGLRDRVLLRLARISTDIPRLALLALDRVVDLRLRKQGAKEIAASFSGDSLERLMRLIWALDDDCERTMAMARVVDTASACSQKLVIEEIGSLRSQYLRARLLVLIAPHVDTELHCELLEAANDIFEVTPSRIVFSGLIPHLRSEIQERAYSLGEERGGGSEFALRLAVLGKYDLACEHLCSFEPRPADLSCLALTATLLPSPLLKQLGRHARRQKWRYGRSGNLNHFIDLLRKPGDSHVRTWLYGLSSEEQWLRQTVLPSFAGFRSDEYRYFLENGVYSGFAGYYRLCVLSRHLPIPLSRLQDLICSYENSHWDEFLLGLSSKDLLVEGDLDSTASGKIASRTVFGRALSDADNSSRSREPFQSTLTRSDTTRRKIFSALSVESSGVCSDQIIEVLTRVGRWWP